MAFSAIAKGKFDPEPSWSGTVRWSGDRLWIALHETSRPELLWVGYVRDRESALNSRVLDEWFDPADRTSPRIGRVQFEIGPPMLTHSALTDRESYRADPLIWFDGSTEGLEERLARGAISAHGARREGSMTILEFRESSGGVETYWFDRDRGHVLVRWEHRHEGVRLTSTSEWETIRGCQVLKRRTEDFRFTNESGSYQSDLVFSEIEVGRRFTEAELSPDSLPIPLGARGVDRRKGQRSIVKEIRGFVPEGSESAEAKAAYQASLPDWNARASRLRDARMAERAREHGWLAARIAAGVALTLLMLAAGVRWWRRR